MLAGGRVTSASILLTVFETTTGCLQGLLPQLVGTTLVIKKKTECPFYFTPDRVLQPGGHFGHTHADKSK